MSATITPIGGNGSGAGPSASVARKRRSKNPIPRNRRSGGSAYDDLALLLERARFLTRVLIDRMDGADENILLAHQIRMELEDLDRLASSQPADWYDEGGAS